MIPCLTVEASKGLVLRKIADEAITTGKQHVRSFAYQAYLDRLRTGTD